MTTEQDEIMEAHRRWVRAAMFDAVQAAASYPERAEIDPLIRALETVAIMLQFAAMIAVAHEVTADQFASLSESMFAVVERNKPDADGVPGSSSQVH